MSDPATPGEKGSLTFLGAWLLLHEKADDWIRDALRRANETPSELRNEYHRLLLAVEREKEALKGLLSQAARNELRELGFLHREDVGAVLEEVRDLRSRLAGLEEKLERFCRNHGED